MALTKYKAHTPPTLNLRGFVDGELRQIEVSIDSIINIFNALNVPIEIGPPDSAGVGYRTLRIPN